MENGVETGGVAAIPGYFPGVGVAIFAGVQRDLRLILLELWRELLSSKL